MPDEALYSRSLGRFGVPRVRLRRRAGCRHAGAGRAGQHYPPAYHPIVYDWGGIYIGGTRRRRPPGRRRTTRLRGPPVLTGTQNELNPSGVVRRRASRRQHRIRALGGRGRSVPGPRLASPARAARHYLAPDYCRESTSTRHGSPTATGKGRLCRRWLVVLCQGRRGMDARRLHRRVLSPAEALLGPVAIPISDHALPASPLVSVSNMG